MEKKNEYLRQITFSSTWLIFLMLVGVFFAQSVYASKLNFLQACAFSSLLVITIFGTALITLKILIPKLLINRQGKLYLLLYLLCSLLLMGAIANCLVLAENALVSALDIDITKLNVNHVENVEVGRVRYFFLSLFSFAICNIAFFRNKMQEEALNNEILSNEKKTLEMKILKSQINTHFLHNALNNIYSMIYFGNKDDASKYVMKLSQMLRYVLDDCEANNVPIAKEVAYIENYIDFQKARFETDRNIVFKYVQNDVGDIHIPPMIFQPLIENCFKHCPLQDDNSFVNVEIVVENRQIKLISENTKPAIKQPSDRNGGGIGIENLKSRLYLNYKDNYSLNVSEKGNIYRTELIINL